MAMLKKRCRDEQQDTEFDINNCLMLLSKVGKPAEEKSLSGRVFACKTCNKEFSSFQALGGHRASHKKPKLTAADLYGYHTKLGSSAARPTKTHECSICGVEFAMGQALGGHMRRHRAAATVEQSFSASPPPTVLQVPVMKKSSSKRVLCLDLNLTPFENDLDLHLGKIMTPVL